MLKNINSARIKKVDSTLTIYELFKGESFNCDFVIAELNGKHNKLINRVSDRLYYVLEGEAKISVGEDIYDATKGDLIVINKNTPHGLEGTIKYIIITAPPYSPLNETKL